MTKAMLNRVRPLHFFLFFYLCSLQSTIIPMKKRHVHFAEDAHEADADAEQAESQPLLRPRKVVKYAPPPRCKRDAGKPRIVRRKLGRPRGRVSSREKKRIAGRAGGRVSATASGKAVIAASQGWKRKLIEAQLHEESLEEQREASSARQKLRRTSITPGKQSLFYSLSCM